MSEGKTALFVEERQNQILRLLKKEKKLLVPQLCEYFGVSSATIRNDLNELESRGLLKRTHGGCILGARTGFEQQLDQRMSRQNAEKEAIGRVAARMVEDGDTLVIDTGSTAQIFARYLLGKKGLTVVTNDLRIAAMLEEQSDATVIFAGGTVRRKYHCTLGPLTLSCLQGLRVDKCFIAANGITVEHGLSTPDMQQAEVKRLMVHMAEQVIALCDSSKIGSDGFVNFAPISSLHLLITDSGLDCAEAERFTQAGVEVRLADIQTTEGGHTDE